MRSLLCVALLVLTCSPEPTAPPAVEASTAPAKTVQPHTAWPAPTATSDVALVRLVVATPRSPSVPWTTRAREDASLDSDDLQELLVPPDADWPDDPVADALHTALLFDQEAPDAEQEAVWLALHAEVRRAGLADALPGQQGDPWTRYATLWLHYLMSAGIFMEDDDRDMLLDGIDAALQAASDHTVEGPLVLASALLEVDDDAKTDRYWELVDAHDERFAVVGMEALLDEGVPADAFDALHLDPEGAPELLRRRLHLEAVHDDPHTSRAVAAHLLAHPLAEDVDRQDARELSLREQADAPVAPWARALVDDAAACADLWPGETVHLEVRGDVWTTSGEGSAADCLYGWSWAGSVSDRDVELVVVRG